MGPLNYNSSNLNQSEGKHYPIEEASNPLDKRFPALKEYKALNRHLNDEHLKFYGNQAIFQKKTVESVRDALDKIASAKENNSFGNLWLRKFLSGIGMERHEIAELSDPDNKGNYAYGVERFSPLTTNIVGAYSSYAEKANKLSKENFSNSITVLKGSASEKKIVLSRVEPHLFVKNLSSIRSIYAYFWATNDPVAEEVFSLCSSILSDEIAPEALKNKIADLHWLVANVAPFERGSSWCAEVLTDVCWLYNGYIPKPIEHGKSLDLEALTSTREAFRANYPMGKSVV